MAAPVTPTPLESVRQEIDEVDRAVVRLLAQRHTLVIRAAELKRATGHPVFDIKRQDAVLQNVRHAAQLHGLPIEFANTVWPALMQLWVGCQEQSADAGGVGPPRPTHGITRCAR